MTMNSGAQFSDGERKARRQLAVAALILGLAVASLPAVAECGGSHGSHSTVTQDATGVAGHSHGQVKRSGQAKHEFRKAHSCRSTGKKYRARPGYVIDHVAPLKRGGLDASGNMQWQTQAAARQKDRWERPNSLG